MCLPQPHPLDFDWRYSDGTVRAIAAAIATSATVVAGGTPSIARYLDSTARDTILVDRQPFQDVKKHVVSEVGQVPLKVRHAVAVLDPPWYPEEAMQWIAWAAGVVGIGGEILISLWPADTRPTGGSERAILAEWVGSWAELSATGIPIEYSAPSFEQAANAVSNEKGRLKKPRFGELLRIVVGKQPTATMTSQKTTRWIRFNINDYQLAIRDDPATSDSCWIEPVPGATGWIWPHVSRRASGREEITLWSSQNEVAVVGNTAHLIEMLRAYLTTHLTATELFRVYPQLAQWSIPAPPFWRVAEWQHQQ